MGNDRLDDDEDIAVKNTGAKKTRPSDEDIAVHLESLNRSTEAFRDAMTREAEERTLHVCNITHKWFRKHGISIVQKDDMWTLA